MNGNDHNLTSTLKMTLFFGGGGGGGVPQHQRGCIIGFFNMKSAYKTKATET